MTTIVILNGPMGCGKDELRKELQKKFALEHLEFKDPLDILAAGYFRMPLDQFQKVAEDRAQKEKRMERFLGLSPRKGRIHVSENIVKPQFGHDTFGELLAWRINQDTIIASGGFNSELIPLARAPHITEIIAFRISCAWSKFDPITDSRSYYSSELGGYENKVHLYNVHNIWNEFPAFVDQVSTILKQHIDEKQSDRPRRSAKSRPIQTSGESAPK